MRTVIHFFKVIRYINLFIIILYWAKAIHFNYRSITTNKGIVYIPAMLLMDWRNIQFTATLLLIPYLLFILINLFMLK